MPYPKNLTTKDVLRRCSMRVLYCTIPYLVLASMLAYFAGNSTLFNGFGFWLCIVIIPVFGLLIDLRRMRDNPSLDRKDAMSESDDLTNPNHKPTVTQAPTAG